MAPARRPTALPISRPWQKLRAQIDQIDAETFELLSKRMRVAEEIGRVKKENNVAILQGGRWSSIVDRSSRRLRSWGSAKSFSRPFSKPFISRASTSRTGS